MKDEKLKIKINIMRCQEKLNKKNSNGPDFGNYLGHLTFFFIHPAFFKILKMSLWVFLVINNILVLSHPW